MIKITDEYISVEGTRIDIKTELTLAMRHFMDEGILSKGDLTEALEVATLPIEEIEERANTMLADMFAQIIMGGLDNERGGDYAKE